MGCTEGRREGGREGGKEGSTRRVAAGGGGQAFESRECLVFFGVEVAFFGLGGREGGREGGKEGRKEGET